ncbi:hypothetical protein Tco_0240532 [Tanacetum coccineum]
MHETVQKATQLSIMSQEPVLFNSSIEDNISYGFDGKASTFDIKKVAVRFLPIKLLESIIELGRMFKRWEHSFETYKSEMFLSLLSLQEAESFHLSCAVLLSNPFNLLLADEDFYNGCNRVMTELFLFSVYNLPKEGSTSGTSLLFTVFLASMTLGTVLMAFLKKRDDEEIEGERDYSPGFYTLLVSLWKQVVTSLCDTRLLLIVSLIAYSGLQQAFVWAEFTKYYIQPSLGEFGVIDAMDVYGIFDAIVNRGTQITYMLFNEHIKLEDVVSVQDAIDIKLLKTMLMFDFEAKIWTRYGRANYEPSDRAMHFDWDSRKTYVYHCYVSIDGTYQFKVGHFLNVSFTVRFEELCLQGPVPSAAKPVPLANGTATAGSTEGTFVIWGS